MKKHLKNLLENIIAGDNDNASKYLHEYLLSKGSLMLDKTEDNGCVIAEDHEDDMSKDQLHKHLLMLWKKCDDKEKKSKFLNKLRKILDDSDIEEDEVAEHFEELCELSKEECDKHIHALEKIVGYTYKPKDE